MSVQGLPDLAAALNGLTVQLQRRILRNALAKAGRVVRDDAKRHAPVMRAGVNADRTPGLLRKSIAVRTSKQATRRGEVGVYVTVKRPPGARYAVTKVRGVFTTRSKRTLKKASQRTALNDPFYWRFVEAGTSKMQPRNFLRRAAGTLGRALEVFKADIAPQIQRLNGRVR